MNFKKEDLDSPEQIDRKMKKAICDDFTEKVHNNLKQRDLKI